MQEEQVGEFHPQFLKCSLLAFHSIFPNLLEKLPLSAVDNLIGAWHQLGMAGAGKFPQVLLPVVVIPMTWASFRMCRSSWSLSSAILSADVR